MRVCGVPVKKCGCVCTSLYVGASSAGDSRSQDTFLKKKKQNTKTKNKMTCSEGGRGECVWLLPGGECPGCLPGGLVLRGTNLRAINLIAANSTGILLPHPGLWGSAGRLAALRLGSPPARPGLWDPAPLSAHQRAVFNQIIVTRSRQAPARPGRSQQKIGAGSRPGLCCFHV